MNAFARHWFDRPAFYAALAAQGVLHRILHRAEAP